MSALASLEAVANSLEADRDAHIAAAERLGQQLAAVLRAIELFDVDTPAEAEPEPTKRPPFDEPTKLTRVACPDCGEMFDPRGLGVHRARKHPDSGAKPVELRPVPSFDPDAARARAAAAI